ncbi:hypothetical protein FB451DRAFT_1478919 [Mycena latifolia]|nr:hypothetical protein FB451DRAFT_1478919 [Mycena latifolia]
MCGLLYASCAAHPRLRYAYPSTPFAGLPAELGLARFLMPSCPRGAVRCACVTRFALCAVLSLRAHHQAARCARALRVSTVRCVLRYAWIMRVSPLARSAQRLRLAELRVVPARLCVFLRSWVRCALRAPSEVRARPACVALDLAFSHPGSQFSRAQSWSWRTFLRAFLCLRAHRSPSASRSSASSLHFPPHFSAYYRLISSAILLLISRFSARRDGY